MSTTPGPRILVIEDNRDLALGLRVNLEEHGYEVAVAHTVAAGIASVRRLRPDLLLLDLALPDGDGLDLMRQLRAEHDETLILVLTARGSRDAKVRGLRDGADDYVTKPFDLAELLARVDVLLRRSRRDHPVSATASLPERIELGNVTIDLPARSLRRGDATLAVSRIGFELLIALLRRRGEAVSRTELMREVWGYGEGVLSRTLDTHVFELRRLIERDAGTPRYIRTVWGVGYRLDC